MANTPRSERLAAAGRAAAMERHHGAEDPRTRHARASLAEQKLTDYVRQVVAAAPEMTAEQRSRVAALLLTPTN